MNKGDICFSYLTIDPIEICRRHSPRLPGRFITAGQRYGAQVPETGVILYCHLEKLPTPHGPIFPKSRPVHHHGKGRPFESMLGHTAEGMGEVVLYAQGSSARQTVLTDGKPVDCTIMAIVDVIETGGEVRFEKGSGRQSA